MRSASDLCPGQTGVRQGHHRLFPITAGEVRPPQVVPCGLCQEAQDPVPGLVAVIVVDCLEEVAIEHREREGLVTGSQGDGLAEEVHEGPPVVEASQAVHHRGLLDLPSQAPAVPRGGLPPRRPS